jgi:hypothetical protein
MVRQAHHEEPAPRSALGTEELIGGSLVFLVRFACVSQHSPDSFFKRLQVLFDDCSNCQWIDVAQVVVYENVAKAADFAPGDGGEGGLFVIRQ